MSWLVAVIIGHFLNAVSYVLDKVLLSKSIDNPFAFTFYIGVLGLLGVVLIPFGFEVPDGATIIFNFITGATFIAALLFFFLSLRDAEASRIVPFIGGGVPVFTLVFELLFLESSLSTYQLIAFAVLVFGTVLITLEKKSASGGKPGAKKNTWITWLFAILSALFFAISFGMTKIAFETQPFISAFVWIRFGSFLFPLAFLLFASPRKAIVQALPILKTKEGGLYLIAQAFGAVGFIFINYAISLASVSLVNALQGVQYALLLILAIIGTLKYPNLLKESMSRETLAVKIVAVFIIGIGLYMIAQSTQYG